MREITQTSQQHQDNKGATSLHSSNLPYQNGSKDECFENGRDMIDGNYDKYSRVSTGRDRNNNNNFKLHKRLLPRI